MPEGQERGGEQSELLLTDKPTEVPLSRLRERMPEGQVRGASAASCFSLLLQTIPKGETTGPGTAAKPRSWV